MKNCKYTFNCKECGDRVESSLSKRRYCSVQCQRKYYSKDLRSFDPGIAAGTVGSISELMVSCDLMKNGYAVFRALSPSCFCDLIAVKGDTWKKFEVRTGRISKNGKVAFPETVNKSNGGPTDYAIYVPKENKIYYYPINKGTSRAIREEVLAVAPSERGITENAGIGA